MKQQFAWSSRIYSVLLRLYPKSFREDYAQEMLWTFEDMVYATLKEQGNWGILGLWLRVLPDWCFTVVKEQLENVGYKGAKQMSFNNQLTSTLALFSRALRAGRRKPSGARDHPAIRSRYRSKWAPVMYQSKYSASLAA